MDLYSHGYKLDLSPEKFGELRESNDIAHDGAAIRSRIEQDGYLLLRGLVDRERVLEARREILLKFAIVGEIDAINHPLMQAVQSEESIIDKVNLVAFTESIRSGQAFSGIGRTPELLAVLERYFDEPPRSFDFRWSRFVRPGETTGFHSDSPYVNRGSQLVTSAWIPLGDVTQEEGALLVLENSHKNLLVKERYSDRDSDRDGLGWLSTNPITLQRLR